MDVMGKGMISRTFYTCKAVGFVIDGISEDGLPKFSTVETDEYIVGNANDMALAKRLLKLEDKKVVVDTIRVEIVDEEVRAMTLNDFYNGSLPVKREANGRVKS